MARQLRLTSDDRDWMAELHAGAVTLDGGHPVAVRDTGDGRFEVDGDPARAGIAALSGDVVWVSVDGAIFEFTISSGTVRAGGRSADALTPPMPATVVRIAVKVGDAVRARDTVLVLEAMKMELPIRAPHDGVITKINCREGELVQPGTVLVEFE